MATTDEGLERGTPDLHVRREVDGPRDGLSVKRSRLVHGPHLHGLEGMKVHRPRFTPKLPWRWRDKEWWYTGAYDRDTGVYVSWYFVRVNLIDKLTMTVFDPDLDERALPRLNQFCHLDPKASGDGLALEGRGRNLKATYRLMSEGRWTFGVKSNALSADIDIEQTIPAFTKFDNEMKNRYAILHYFQSRANGEVRAANGRVYKLSNALVYQDHCFGRVPRSTAWHWIAVQSGRIALTVLINYGADAQRFAQVWLGPEIDSPRPREWIRLEQNVSFECEDFADPRSVWRVSSTDLELRIEPAKQVTEKTKILPLLGGLVDLKHTEASVKVEGRVRVDGRWIKTDPMFGVFEQHQGHW